VDEHQWCFKFIVFGSLNFLRQVQLSPFSLNFNNKDNGQDIPEILERDYSIEKQKVEIIDNNGSLLDSTARINKFVYSICELESIPGS
jgi:hypothetical protein